MTIRLIVDIDAPELVGKALDEYVKDAVATMKLHVIEGELVDYYVVGVQPMEGLAVQRVDVRRHGDYGSSSMST